MKTEVIAPGDVALRDQILAELKWEPRVSEAHIGVSAENGVVTLMGTVPTWPEREAAERAALRISGVKAIANDLRVRLPGGGERTDSDIAREAANALAWNSYVPRNEVKPSVHDGTITLTGKVEWQYQRTAAEDAVRYLRGIKHVDNQITIQSRLVPAEIHHRIAAALERNAIVEARNVTVEAIDRKVTLRGKVSSCIEREAAEQAAWAAPGVSQVQNEIRVLDD